MSTPCDPTETILLEGIPQYLNQFSRSIRLPTNAKINLLSLYLLGIPRIELTGTAISVDTRKAIALIAFLAIKGETQPRDSLAVLLWPDLDQKRARGALRRTLSSLKSQIGDSYLQTSRENIGLNPTAEIWIDVERFRNLLSQAEQSATSTNKQLAHLTNAVELYRDSFMAGFTLRDAFPFDDWQFIEAESLRRELSHALAQLVQLQTNAGLLPEAISIAQRWLAMDPLQEKVHRQLMRLYTWTGERNTALRQYGVCEQVLDDELGVPPLEETTKLFQLIQDNQLEPRPVPSTPVEGNAVLQQTILQTEQGRTDLSRLSKESQPAPAREPLVGRDRQLDQLWETYHQIEENGSVVALEGETGIGKSRLASEFIEQVIDQRSIAISVRCYEGESHLAYAPIVQCIREAMKRPDLQASLQKVAEHHLAEVTRLIPELAAVCSTLPAALPVESPGAQSRFFDAVCQLLTALCQSGTPGVLFFDDFHWADSTSLDLLAFLMRRLHGKRLLILLAWRDEELTEAHRLLQLVAETQRTGFTTQVVLPRLRKAEIAEYVQIVRPKYPPDYAKPFVKRLWQETEGLPYFLVEYINASASTSTGTTQAAEVDDIWHIPSTIRDFLLSHIASLGEMARQLLQTAAVIGRAFDAELLQAGSGRSDEEFVIGLEGLLAHQLVREKIHDAVDGEAATANYDFHHDKLRVLVYEEMSLVRRRMLHRRMATTLSQQAERQARVDSMAGVIAHHLHLAGQEAEAATYYRRAAGHARSLYANDEALSHYQMALKLGDPDRATLYVACGDLYKLSGHYDAALDSYREARALYQKSESATHHFASVAYKLGHVFYRRGEWELAEEQFIEASNIWSMPEDIDDRAALYAEWSHVAYLRQEPQRAIELAKQSLALAQKALPTPSIAVTTDDAEPIALAQAYNVLGILTRHEGDLAEAIAYLEKSLQTVEQATEQAIGQTTGQSHHPQVRVAALNNLGLAQLEAKDPAGARANFEAALQLCRKVGDRHREAAIYNNLADAHHQAGDEESAMIQLKKAVKIFAELGKSANEWQPEIWQLTEW